MILLPSGYWSLWRQILAPPAPCPLRVRPLRILLTADHLAGRILREGAHSVTRDLFQPLDSIYSPGGKSALRTRTTRDKLRGDLVQIHSTVDVLRRVFRQKGTAWLV